MEENAYDASPFAPFVLTERRSARETALIEQKKVPSSKNNCLPVFQRRDASLSACQFVRKRHGNGSYYSFYSGSNLLTDFTYDRWLADKRGKVRMIEINSEIIGKSRFPFLVGND